jgi:hypothetical protein
MITSVEELKALTTWMKEQKVSSFKADGFEVQFAPQALVPAALTGLPDEPKRTQEEIEKEYEDLLFHSAG